MTQIENILLNSTKFHDPSKKDNFIGLFKELYKIDLFKIGLDVILTKAEMGLVKFKIEQLKPIEQLHGCCITEKKTSFSKLFKSFVNTHHHLIKLQTLNEAVLMHEIAHALEKESRLNINNIFAKAFKLDLQNLENGHMLIREAIKQIIFKEMNLYPKAQHNSEFLARYFELLARSKEVGGYGENYHFKLKEIQDIFINSTKYVKEIFNESLKSQVREHISLASEKVTFDQNLGNFARKEKSLHQSQKPNWGQTTKSLFDNDPIKLEE